MEKKKLIIDTDVGTDFDDAFALLLACQSEEIELLGVTTVWSNAYERARIAKKVLKIAGKQDIPVCAGISKPIDGSGTVWYGYEGGGIMDEGDWTDPALAPEKKHAVDFIIDTVMANPGEVTVITIEIVFFYRRPCDSHLIHNRNHHAPHGNHFLNILRNARFLYDCYRQIA